MNNVSKGMLATVCLTGNLTVERIHLESNPQESLVTVNHHFGFGFTTAFASGDDGDARQECLDNASLVYNECIRDAEQQEWAIVRLIREAACADSFKTATTLCNML